MARIRGRRHQETRSALRIIGPLVAGVGLIFTLIGVSNFFSSAGSYNSGFGNFWCAFVGLPLIGVGVMICKFAYMGAVGRYVAGEVAPVAKDTINYMAEGTKDSIRDMAGAVGQGLAAARGSDREAEQVIRCHKCNEDNDSDSKFCKRCGAPLEKSKPCPSCKEMNDPDARFCDNCGHEYI